MYCFNTKSDVWWEQSKAKFGQLSAEVYRFEWSEIQSLAAMVQRTMPMSLMITGNSAYITIGEGQCEVSWTRLSAE